MTAARGQLNRVIALAGDDFRVLQRQIDQRLQMRLVSGKEGKLTKKMITSLLLQTPHGAEAHKSLAYYHIFRGDWAQGVEVLAEFTAEHPNYPNGWYYYGLCLFDTGEYQKAAQMMGKAYHLYPDDCEIYRGLCEILPFVMSDSATHRDPPKSPFLRGTFTHRDPPKSPLKRGTLNRTPVPSLKRGTLNSTVVPCSEDSCGARGEQPTVDEIGMTSSLGSVLKPGDPPCLLNNGENLLLVPLIKGDLGGSKSGGKV